MTDGLLRQQEVVDEFLIRVKVVQLVAPDNKQVGAKRREILTTIVKVVFNLENIFLLLFRFQPLGFSEVLGASLAFLVVGGKRKDTLRLVRG